MTNTPTNFHQVDAGDFILAWDAPTDDTTRYEVSRNGTFYYGFRAHNPDATQFADAWPNPGTTFTLVALDAAGNASDPATYTYVGNPEQQPLHAEIYLAQVVDLYVRVYAFNSYDPNGHSLTTALWDFGDGTPQQTLYYGDKVEHTYAAAGAYTVTLTVTCTEGVTGTVSESFSVHAPSPVDPTPVDPNILTGTEGTFTVQDFSGALTITKTYTPTFDGSLVMQVTDSAGWLPVFVVTNAAGDEIQDDVDGVLSIVWIAGQQMTITITAADAQPTADVTFNWTYAARASSALSVSIDEPEVTETPGGLEIFVFGGLAEDTITLSLIGPSAVADFQTATLDDDGNFEGLIVELPALQAGPYDLRIESTQSGSEDTSFTVTQDALSSGEDVRPLDVAPVRDPAQHWRFYDPFDADNTYTFVNNPASWTNVFPPNDFTHNKTTALNGQPLTWQASARPWRMEFTGTTFTQDEHAALVFWSQLRRRFWLIDHRNRAWLMTIEQFDAQPQVKPGYPWLHQYTVKTLVFMQGQ